MNSRAFCPRHPVSLDASHRHPMATHTLCVPQTGGELASVKRKNTPPQNPEVHSSQNIPLRGYGDKTHDYYALYNRLPVLS